VNTPPEITPDSKDWTWVLRRPCPECDFDTRMFPHEATGQLLRDNARAWQPVLAAPDARHRPRPDRWSPLEYGCHVRDTSRIYLYRLGLMLDTDDPLFPNWDQDETAVSSRYHAQDPVVVAGELAAAAGELAVAFDGVTGKQWRRKGRRSDGADFTVETFARYFIHDPIHHLWDVTGRW
jgi:hypothetical protein